MNQLVCKGAPAFAAGYTVVAKLADISPLPDSMANRSEPPCTDPYARWCASGRAARPAPIPIGPSVPSVRRRPRVCQNTKVEGFEGSLYPSRHATTPL
ncbi:hypothetical protein [Paraburkholderia sp. GAS32]|uniref:hypothetical protein n=1 Tax=Paraburkholderia sp. GAS32 TaxID=3035129 RepID=UPI003D190EC4